MKIESHESLIEFKEQLTYLLIGTLFVLLAADVRMADILKLGWPGFLTVLSVMFIVRPINILVCTRNTNLTFKEKILCSWSQLSIFLFNWLKGWPIPIVMELYTGI